jgi:type IV secretory pathway VirB4 component
VFRSDTGALAGLYPFLDGAGLPAVGAFIGWDTLTMRAFCAHPAAWVRAGITSNANVLVSGVPGAGKSALVKALVFRLMVFGVRCLVLGDIKGEYDQLAAFLGVEPVRLGRGLPTRINPLDSGLAGRADHGGARSGRDWLQEVHRRRLTLTSSLLGVRLPRPLAPLEESALSLAIRTVTGETSASSQLTEPTIAQVHAALRGFDREAADVLGVRSAWQLQDKTEDLVHALANMIDGSLGGLFDGPTNTALDLDAPLQTVDLSGLSSRSEETVAMVLACVSSWGQACVDASDHVTAVVRDEVWRQLRFPALVRKVDSDLRLQRADGTIQIVATHRLSDFEAVGPAGSQEVAIAKHLVSSFDTRVQLAQDTGPLRLTRAAVGLTDAECSLVSSWGPQQRGRALWKVGHSGASFPVQLVLSALERELFETDTRMGVG